MASSETKSIILSSSFEEVKRVEPFVKELQQWAGFSDELFGNVMLTLNEAVTNAIVHGNKEDASKKVFVKARLDDGNLKISIRDEGEGFDPDTLPNPLEDENLLKEGGRGVYLIEQFSDELKFSEEGTKLTIQFYLQDDDRGKS